LCLLRPCFVRAEPWLQAGKYLNALVSGLPRCNGWTIAECAGDQAPDRTERLLKRETSDTAATMSVVRRFAAAGRDEAARRSGRWRGLVIGRWMRRARRSRARPRSAYRAVPGCAGRVANGINTMHLAYVRERAGHALIGSRQWIPRPDRGSGSFPAHGLPLDLEFRTKGQLAAGIAADALAEGICFDLAGGEVYGSCTELGQFFEGRGQAYVLRVPRTSASPCLAGRRNLRGRRQPAGYRTPGRGPVRREKDGTMTSATEHRCRTLWFGHRERFGGR
jgi:hypothetical protein